MKIALDSNVLVYAEGVDTPAKQDAANRLLDRARRAQLVVPAQVLGETFNVLVRKRRLTQPEARARVLAWAGLCEVVGTSSQALFTAFDLAAERRLQIWDAVILAVAAETGCDLLLSEDLQDGFVWRGVTVANPFKDELHPLLADVLEARS
ncbi:MAG TPA: PIN domain-containing protein [Caulobacteraceae bacterium]|nr:PIN domain-containing protein [Caulobacteraceae bacterium]